jgi:hypothetical protein
MARLAKNDSGFGKIVRRQLKVHFVTRNDPNKIFAHLSGDVREDQVSVGQLDPEHGAGQDVNNDSFAGDAIFFRHGESWALAGFSKERNLSSASN